MFIRGLKQHKQSFSPSPHTMGRGPGRGVVFLAAAIVLALAGVFIARTAFARIILNAIDPVGIVAEKGRSVTVTQRSTSAVAEGEAVLTGTGTTNQWEVVADAAGKERFAPGPATAVALGRPTLRGNATDAHQWLVNITLVQEQGGSIASHCRSRNSASGARGGTLSPSASHADEHRRRSSTV